MSNVLKVGLVAGVNPFVAPFVKAAVIRAAAAAGVTIEIIEDEFEKRKDAPDERFALEDSKLAVLESLWRLQEKGCDFAFVGSIGPESFLAEAQTELTMPVMSLYAGAAEALKAMGKSRVGRLGCGVSEAFIATVLPECEIVASRENACNRTTDMTLIREDADYLLAHGADVLVPCCGRIESRTEELLALGYPVLDIFEVAAKHVFAHLPARRPKPFKVGLIGGLGPAATVDLYDKIVRATPAKNDQEHFKVTIEQNPQISDRTACLLNGGADPTLAMYGCARRLEKSGCDAIIVPCNTAHAFVPYLERYLKVPFINMQVATMEEIMTKLGKDARIGLLATTGTVKTRIYAAKAEAAGIQIFTPDEEHQERVMRAIYGPEGAKAGFTTGSCRNDLVSAAEYLVKTYDCNCLILGCTELPLILDESDAFPCAGKTVTVIDPTSALARKVVRTAEAAYQERGIR